jgi:ABC-type multidrug transport system permease subunit
VRRVANVFPLTHILNAARSIMLDGSTLVDVAPELLTLALMSAAFLFIAASTFRWRSN